MDINGAIAIGQPLCVSGGLLMTTLLPVLGQREGLQARCEAGGLADATILEWLRRQYDGHQPRWHSRPPDGGR